MNLCTGTLAKYDRNLLLTKSSPVAYDPAARLDLWDKSSPDWQDKPDVITFLQVAAGYRAAGTAEEEKLFFLHGVTNSGKTTFVESIKSALGDYAMTADFQTFLRKTLTNGGSASGDIARLAGSRLVSSSETDEGKELAEGLVKNLVGGEKIVARFMYNHEFEYLPTFKLWLIANDAPHISADDAAMWRRIVRIPFDRTVPDGRRNPAVKMQLTDPTIGGPAVLAWIVAGCRLWRERGLIVPACLVEATEGLRTEMDTVAGFFNERCTFEPGALTRSADLRTAYANWGPPAARRFMLSHNRFAKKLQERGCVSAWDAQGERVWQGVKLNGT